MALIAVAADKGAPGVTTTSVALAAVWPRPVLLAECDPAGGDLVYRLPSADGHRLDPRRGLISLAVAARRGLQPSQVWEHAQKLRGGLDVLVGLTNAEQGSGLDLIWGQVGAALAGLPEADVIADCGRLGPDGHFYDLVARADAVILISRASLADMVRIRDRVAAVDGAIRRRHGPGRACVVVMADYKHFGVALGEVKQVLSTSVPAPIVGGIAYEPKSAELLSGEWGGKLDKSLLIRTARQVAAQLAGQLPAGQGAGALLPPEALEPAPPAPERAAPRMQVQQPPAIPSPVMDASQGPQAPTHREPMNRPPIRQGPPPWRQLPAPQAPPTSGAPPIPPAPPTRAAPPAPPVREPLTAETYPHELLQPLPQQRAYPQQPRGARGSDQPPRGQYADPEHTADLLPGLRQEPPEAPAGNGERTGRGRHAGPSGVPSTEPGRR